MFNDLKEVIGDFHFTPKEAFEYYFGENTFEDGTVIAIALPYSNNVLGNKKGIPSKKLSLIAPVLKDLSNYIIKLLNSKGYKAIDPSSEDFFKISTTKDIYSNWSQRHIAYISGLGTFSLTGGLITDSGKSVLILTLVTDLLVKEDKRQYSSLNEYCLYDSKGSCGKCIERCKYGAISSNGVDKNKCLDMSFDTEASDLQAEIDSNYGCGLCLIDVPCENEKPVPK